MSMACANEFTANLDCLRHGQLRAVAESRGLAGVLVFRALASGSLLLAMGHRVIQTPLSIDH